MKTDAVLAFLITVNPDDGMITLITPEDEVLYQGYEAIEAAEATTWLGEHLYYVFKRAATYEDLIAEAVLSAASS